MFIEQIINTWMIVDAGDFLLKTAIVFFRKSRLWI